MTLCSHALIDRNISSLLDSLCCHIASSLNVSDFLSLHCQFFFFFLSPPPSLPLIAPHFLCPLPLQATCNTLSDPTGWEYTEFVTDTHTHSKCGSQTHGSSPDAKCHLSARTGGDGEKAVGCVNNITDNTTGVQKTRLPPTDR